VAFICWSDGANVGAACDGILILNLRIKDALYYAVLGCAVFFRDGDCVAGLWLGGAVVNFDSEFGASVFGMGLDVDPSIFVGVHWLVGVVVLLVGSVHFLIIKSLHSSFIFSISRSIIFSFVSRSSL
jgi:hypothetical protein